MEDNEHIHQHLKQSLENYSVQPKVTSFDAIQKKMEKKKRRRILFFLFPGLLAGLAAAIFYFTLPVSDSQKYVEKESSMPPEIKSEKRDESKKTANETKPNIVKTQSEKTQNDKQIPQKENTPGPDNPTVKATQSPSKNISPASQVLEEDLFVKNVNPSEEEKSNPSPTILNSADQQTLSPDIEKIENADQLEIPFKNLPLINNEKEPRLSFTEISLAQANDSTPKKKKVSFFVGAGFNPQMGTYILRGNSSEDYAKRYLENKQKQNAIKFNYAYGLKLGVLFKEKWELIAGFGCQRYTQQEKIMAIADATVIPNFQGFPLVAQSVNSFDASGAVGVLNETYKNIYQYWNYSLEINRIYVFNKVTKIKLGMGMHLQRIKLWSLRNNENRQGWISVADGEENLYYYGVNNMAINRSLYSLQIKAGWIEDLNKRLQLQLCPNLSYSLNSMFKRDYLIKQNSLNLGLECLLLFKLR